MKTFEGKSIFEKFEHFFGSKYFQEILNKKKSTPRK